MDILIQQFIAIGKKLREELIALHNSVDAIRHQNEAYEQERSRQNKPEPPPILVQVRSELEIPETEKAAKRTHEKRHLTAQWVQVGVTFLAFVAAAIYAGIATFQLRDFDQSVSLSQIIARQSRIQTAQSRRSADAAKTAAESAQGALNFSQQSLRISERPYISIENVRFDPPLEQSHDPATVKFEFHNAGKTPALKGTFAINVFIDTEKISQIPRDFPSEVTIASDRGAASSMSIWFKKPGDFDGISNGTKKLSFKGKIKYRDIFKQWHPTSFCAVYDGKTKEWVYCPGNDVQWDHKQRRPRRLVT